EQDRSNTQIEKQLSKINNDLYDKFIANDKQFETIITGLRCLKYEVKKLKFRTLDSNTLDDSHEEEEEKPNNIMQKRPIKSFDNNDENSNNSYPDSLKKDINDLKEQYLALNDKVEQFSNEKGKIQKLLVQHHQKIENIKEQLNNKPESSNEENTKLIESLQNSVSSLENQNQQIPKLLSEFNDIKKVLMKNHKHIKENKDEVDQLRDSLDFLKEAFNDFQSTKASTPSGNEQDYGNEISKLIDENRSLQENIASLNMKVRALENKLAGQESPNVLNRGIDLDDIDQSDQSSQHQPPSSELESLKQTVSALKKLILKDHKAIESIKEAIQTVDSNTKKKTAALNSEIEELKDSIMHIQDGDTLRGKITVEFEKLKTIIREQLDPVNIQRSASNGGYGFATNEELDNVKQLLLTNIDELRGDFLVYKEQHKSSVAPLKLTLPPNIESQTIEGIGSFKDLCSVVIKNKIRVAELGRFYNKMDDDFDAFRHQFDVVKHEVKKLMKKDPLSQKSAAVDDDLLTQSDLSLSANQSSAAAPKRVGQKSYESSSVAPSTASTASKKQSKIKLSSMTSSKPKTTKK
ncbi:hypothetical protein M9Y10_039598, partial [Tritrichomonas musculus]